MDEVNRVRQCGDSVVPTKCRSWREQRRSPTQQPSSLGAPTVKPVDQELTASEGDSVIDATLLPTLLGAPNTLVWPAVAQLNTAGSIRHIGGQILGRATWGGKPSPKPGMPAGRTGAARPRLGRLPRPLWMRLTMRSPDEGQATPQVTTELDKPPFPTASDRRPQEGDVLPGALNA